MDINGGQLSQTQYNPVFPGAQSTGPLLAGNVIHSDGTGNLAGVGETTGTANVGYATCVQMQNLTQAGTLTAFNTNIVIPAQSMIVQILFYASTAWTGSGVTITDTNSNNYVAQTAIAAGRTVLTPGTVKLTTQQWENISGVASTGSGDQQIVVTSASSGGNGGLGVLVVEYIQGCNVTQST